MNFSVSWIQGLSLALYFVLLIYAISPVWHQLKIKKVQHLVFGTAAALSVLWWFRTGIYEGLDVHFLWMSAAAMVLGWRWALFSSFIASLVMVFIGHEAWQDLGIYGLINCSLPAIVTFAIYSFSYYKLPRNFFVYVFTCGFFAGTLNIALKMFLVAVLYWVSGQYEWYVLTDNYLILIPLLLFPEGLLNGMTLTCLVIYCPSWVATFYDNKYLDGK